MSRRSPSLSRRGSSLRSETDRQASTTGPTPAPPPHPPLLLPLPPPSSRLHLPLAHLAVGSSHHRAQSLPCSPRGGGEAAYHSPGTAHRSPYSPRGAPHPNPRRPGQSCCAQTVLLHLFRQGATPAHFVPRSPGLQASRSSARLSSLPKPRLGSFRRRRTGFRSLEGRRRGRRWRRRWRERGRRR